MKFLALVCCVASVAATVDWNTLIPKGNASLILNVLEGRIINGQVARRNQFPYQAGLLIRKGNDLVWCGGTLISNKWVLTAAHCTESSPVLEVILGAFNLTDESELGRQLITVNRSNVIVHEGYDSYKHRNDISLIRLPDPVKFDDYIQPAELPINKHLTYSGERAITSGWGRTNNSAPAPTSRLLWINVPILDNSICSEFYPTNTDGTESVIQTSHICISTVGTKAVCSGDSGGPLVLAGSNIVIGVTSFGSIYGCDHGSPNVFTRVTYYLDWISKHTGLKVNSSSLLRNVNGITIALIVITFFCKHLILLHL